MKVAPIVNNCSQLDILRRDPIVEDIAQQDQRVTLPDLGDKGLVEKLTLAGW